ncbi:nudix hydrolase 2-like [Lycium ferocissimum]|uniref:nudix hydrolase 2-like n=1 Tax=Lycium ferocissimum TaxID=112874 RepID=UPI0028155AB5|nr:nudix hydrolase 2-like [Lycium ferocissimum]
MGSIGEAIDIKMEIFEANEDNYGGVTVNMKKKEPMDSHTFHTMLRASISHWRLKGKKGVWIKLPIELAHLVDAAVKEGFWYHHAEATYLMLVYWIPHETPNTLPANASHRVGIGAFVLNDDGQVLVVKEKSGNSTGTWKLPTGVVDEGEDICTAAVREVQEETGIETEFVELLAFRQSHKSFFGKSDLFFICMLKPLNLTIHKQDAEIEEAKWMPIEEYAAQVKLNQSELSKTIAKICVAKKEKQYTGFSALPTTTGHSSKKCYIYSNL